MDKKELIRLDAIKNHNPIELTDLQIFLQNNLTEIKIFYWTVFVLVIIFLIYKIIKINKKQYD